MKLISLWVDEYKNLKDIKVEFLSTEIPIAVIGNNGTGKSNLIEVLLNIFINLYFGKSSDLNFMLEYEAHDKHVKVVKLANQNAITIAVDNNYISLKRFKEWVQKPKLNPPFPELVFGYYSGTCERLERQFKRYSRSYATKIRNQSVDLEASFVFSDIGQAKLTLAGLLAYSHFDFLREINILKIERLVFKLRPPEQFESSIETIKFWGMQGGIIEFLVVLDNAAFNVESSYIQEDGINIEKERRYYVNQEGLEKLGFLIAKRSGVDFFSLLQALSTRKILIEIDYELIHVDQKTTFGFDELSEGEKQLISVIGGLHLARQNECLVLLDEPDTHLNPAWTWKYNSLLKTALRESQKSSSSVLIATHNPVLISGLTKEQVLIAHNKYETLFYDQPVRDPRGQGVANLLASEFFGLPSSLDEYTQSLIDERLRLAYKTEKLIESESRRLKEINYLLDNLGLSISFRDPEYKEFEQSKHRQVDRQ